MHASTWLGNRHVVRCPSGEGTHAWREGTMGKSTIVCTIDQTAMAIDVNYSIGVKDSVPNQDIVLHALRGIVPRCVHANGGE